jgi:chromatin remodeling complex protein RSC6
MVRVKNTPTKSAITVSEPAPTPAPVIVEKTVTKSTKKTKSVATPVIEQVVVPVSVAAVEDVVSEDVEQPIAEQSIEFLAKLQQIGALLSSIKTEYRLLEKKWTRELKTAQKQSSKRKRKSGNRAPSGFVKPTRISDELANFLEKPTGSEMARTEVTRDINKYIRTHNLQDSSNGRKINPDVKLATLLKIKKTDELTYFNLQRYMSPHFAKAGASVAAVDSVKSESV